MSLPSPSAMHQLQGVRALNRGQSSIAMLQYRRPQVAMRTSASHHDPPHSTVEAHLGPNAVTKVGDLSKLSFQTATVIRNE